MAHTLGSRDEWVVDTHRVGTNDRGSRLRPAVASGRVVQVRRWAIETLEPAPHRSATMSTQSHRGKRALVKTLPSVLRRLQLIPLPRYRRTRMIWPSRPRR